MKDFTIRDIGFLFIILLLLVGTIWTFQSMNQTPSVTYPDIREIFLQGEAKYVMIDEDQVLHIQLWDPNEDGESQLSYSLYSVEMFHEDFGDLLYAQRESGILLNYDYPPNPTPSVWTTILPYLIMFALFGITWYFVANRQNGGGGSSGGDRTAKFGKARTRVLDKRSAQVTFHDVAGAKEEKAELQEIVNFLQEPRRFISLGARIPKGVLLVGPPGTGKTLLAKAVAGEAGVHFLSISGSDFVELYVGVGASRVRDLFEQAKKESPAIVFIDEIDAVGRQRGAGLGGGHDEREQTLNQLLVEMDGFAANEGVIVLAATNRVDILDPALLRPGRFDRQVYVGHPDMRGREEILKVHCRKKPLGDDVNLRNVARSTSGFTGADLENLMNESALMAARNKRPFIAMNDVQESIIKVIAGPEKRSHVLSDEDRRITAYHEAGHAIVMALLPTQDPVHRITIVPHGMAAGMTIHLPLEDRRHVSKQKLQEEITTLLGGRVAEEIAIGFVCTGAVNDLQRASEIARNMVTKYGMSETLGNVVYHVGSDEIFLGRSMAQAKPYSESVAGEIDDEIKRLIDDSYQQCHDILLQHRSTLERIAAYLLEHETMDAEEFREVFHQDDDCLSLVEESSPSSPSSFEEEEEDATSEAFDDDDDETVSLDKDSHELQLAESKKSSLSSDE